jgi:hypothetical protein
LQAGHGCSHFKELIHLYEGKAFSLTQVEIALLNPPIHLTDIAKLHQFEDDDTDGYLAR